MGIRCLFSGLWWRFNKKMHGFVKQSLPQGRLTRTLAIAERSGRNVGSRGRWPGWSFKTGPLRIDRTLSGPLSLLHHPPSSFRGNPRAEWAVRGKGAFRGGACDGSGVQQAPEMLRAGWLLLCAALCSLLLGQAEAPSPGVPPERSRPYAVLRGQNLGERGGPRAGSPTGARWRVRGAAAGQSSRSWFSCCQPPALVAGGTCWNWKLETGFLRSGLALRIQARRQAHSHPSSF